MKVIVEMDVTWDGQDEISQEEQLKAIGEMIESGAESFYFNVNIRSLFESPVGTLLDAPNPLYDLNKVCGGCKFYNAHTDECRYHSKQVQSSDKKCDKWRYFA